MSAISTTARETVIDRDLMTRRRLRHPMDRSREARFLHDDAAGELCERLAVTKRDFPRVLLVDDAFGAIGSRIAALPNVGMTYATAPHRDLLSGSSIGVVADEECLPFSGRALDLVVSNLSLHLTNDTPGTLIQIQRAIKPDGLFSASLLGGDTLTELRQSLLAAETELTGGASPRVVPFPDIRDLGSLLQRAGFALPVTDQDRLTVRYDTMFDLMADLRAGGMTNCLSQRSRRPLTRRLFARAAEIYAETFSDPDGRIRATFDVVYLSGWVPHESQQKPARRGSGTVSLRDALDENR